MYKVKVTGIYYIQALLTPPIDHYVSAFQGGYCGYTPSQLYCTKNGLCVSSLPAISVPSGAVTLMPKVPDPPPFTHKTRIGNHSPALSVTVVLDGASGHVLSSTAFARVQPEYARDRI